MLAFNPATQSYAPTEAAAAWLDDDVATGWPAATGQHYYMVSMSEPQLLTNFCISARSTKGTVSIYAGDEAVAPSSKAWTALAKDVSVETINQHLLDKSFSRFAKYLLIETNLTEAGPWYSLYLYGEKPAVSYHLQHRSQPVDPRALFGPYSNSQTAFSVSSLYAHGIVAYVNTPDSATAWQKAIDDNPETQTMLAPSAKASLVIRYDSPRTIQRISVLADGAPKGRLDFFLLNGSAPATNEPANTASTESQFIHVSNESTAGVSDSTAAMKPVATIAFDGGNPRGSADFAPAAGTQLVARWTPTDGAQLLAMREINSFGNLALNDNELAPDAVGEDLTTDSSKDPRDFKSNKNVLPVGEMLAPKTPFIPGLPPFPPNVPFSPR